MNPSNLRIASICLTFLLTTSALARINENITVAPPFGYWVFVADANVDLAGIQSCRRFDPADGILKVDMLLYHLEPNYNPTAVTLRIAFDGSKLALLC